MYKNNILISLIFRPLETVEEDSCTELIQVNKRSRLQPEQSNNQGYNVQLQNLTLKYDIINYVNKVLSDEELYDALKKLHYQQIGYKFPQTSFGKINRSFQSQWLSSTMDLFTQFHVMVPFAYTVCFFVKNPVSMVNLFQNHFVTGKKQLKSSMNTF